MSRFTFFGTEDSNESFNDNIRQEIVLESKNNLFTEGEARYRSEQLCVITIDGIIENHVDTKLEYHVKKYISNNELMVKITLVDQVVNIHPATLQDTLTLMSKIDVIKSDALLVVNPNNGKIDRIANVDEIRTNWFAFKNEVIKTTSYIKSPEMKSNIATYLEDTEKQFTEENLLLDFNVRPFFELFFDTYLVRDEFHFAPYSKLYYSQLFDRLPVDFNIDQTITEETPSTMTILKNGKVGNDNPHLKDFEKVYDLRYKPKIGYKFSEYEYNHETRVSYNLDDKMLNESTMVITEAVKNNIELFIDYKIRRIV